MVQSDDIFLLVKSLTKEEKIHFKRHGGVHVMGEGNNYIRLFDAIDAMKVYDEEALMRKFEGEKFTRQISVAKNYLYRAILKSLKTIRRPRSKKEEILSLLAEVNILFEKRLYGQCKKLLRRAKKIALEYEKHPELMEILSWEMQLIYREDVLKRFSEENINRIFDERKELLKIRENLNEYDRLERNFKTLTGFVKDRESEEYKRKLRKFFAHPLLKGEEKALSTVGRLKYYAIKANYFYETQEDDKSFDYEIKQIRLLDDKPAVKSERFIDYLVLLSNTILLCINLKKYEDYKWYLDKLREQMDERIVLKNTSYQLYIIERSYLMEMVYYNKQKDFAKIVELYDRAKQKAEEKGMELRATEDRNMRYFVCVGYFNMKEYSKALERLNEILNDKEAESRPVEYITARIFNLVLHYELGNMDLLEYASASTQRYIRERKRISKFEMLFFRLMNRLVKRKPGKRESEIFEEFIYELKKLNAGEYRAEMRSMQFLVSWVESKVST